MIYAPVNSAGHDRFPLPLPVNLLLQDQELIFKETGLLNSLLGLREMFKSVSRVFIPQPSADFLGNLEQPPHLILDILCNKTASVMYFLPTAYIQLIAQLFASLNTLPTECVVSAELGAADVIHS